MAHSVAHPGFGVAESLHEHRDERGAAAYLILEDEHVARLKEQRREARNASVDVFTYNLEGEAEGEGVVGTNRFNPKPMHLEEAVMQLATQFE